MLQSVAAIQARQAARSMRRLAQRRLASLSHAEFDVVVCGGGVVGTSVAYHLARASPSLRVAVVERDPSGEHASAPRSAGGIRQQFSLQPNIELSLYGVDFLRRAANDLHVPGEQPPDVQFKENGYLFLASEQGVATLRSNHATQARAGASTVLLEPAELAARFPWLRVDGVALGCFGERGEGWFDPWALVVALKQKAKHMGVTFVRGSVTGFDCAPVGPADAAGDAKMRIEAVTVRDGAAGRAEGAGVARLACGSVVNAAGAWSSELVRLCGAGVAPLPVEARRRCIFSFHAASPAAALATPSASTPLVVDPSGVYFRPEGAAGQFLCGVSPPASRGDPHHDDVAALDEVEHELFDELIWPALYERCEAFGGLKVQAAWAGFYEYNTLDQNALIGKHPHVPNLVLCSGFSGHGLQQAPGAGRAVAELLTTGTYATVDVSCFGMERVLRGEPLFEQNIV